MQCPNNINLFDFAREPIYEQYKENNLKNQLLSHFVTTSGDCLISEKPVIWPVFPGSIHQGAAGGAIMPKRKNKNKLVPDLIPPKGSVTEAFFAEDEDEKDQSHTFWNKNYRKQIRKKIIGVPKNKNSKILPLTWPFIEVIDPASIDTTMLKRIENGDEVLSDSLFFELISESPKYLVYEPFQNKIELWQTLLNDSSVDQETRSGAKKRLRFISTALLKPSDRRGRPTKWRDSKFDLLREFGELKNELETFVQEAKSLTTALQRKKLFEKKFPHLSEYAGDVVKHRTEGAMARKIILKTKPISERSLKDALREYPKRIRPKKSK